MTIVLGWWLLPAIVTLVCGGVDNLFCFDLTVLSSVCTLNVP